MNQGGCGCTSRVEGNGSADFLDSAGCRADVLSKEERTHRKESTDMKRAFFVLLMVAGMAGLNGCCCPHGGGCGSVDYAGCYDTCGQMGYETCGQPNAGLGGLLGMDAGSCRGCGGLCCGLCSGRRRQAYTPGPPVGTVTYPYYTTRGPRDFLAATPPSIGP